METVNLKDAFSERLLQLANENKKIVVVDPEVGRSTKMLPFQESFPERFIECGIAEQNAVGIAAGMAAESLVPIVVAFSPFLTMRPVEIIRCSVFHGNKNVKLIAEYAGFTDGKDGPTHTSMEDIGMIRAIPGSVIISPSDPVMTKKMLEEIVRYNGPVFMRIETENLPNLYDESVEFHIGRSYVLREGTDVLLIAYGSATLRAMQAAKHLSEKGIEATVIDAATIKPFDESLFIRIASKVGRIVSVEDHNIYGGLASVVSEYLARHSIAAKFIPLAIRDVFTESGNADRLRKKYRIDTESIVVAAESLIGRR